jgi:hypothetical protein
MNIDKYIDWQSIWYNEIILLDILGYCNDKYKEVINQFLKDDNVDLLLSECQLLENDELFFSFEESGGQNESDTQGWSRNYDFVFDKDFYLISVEYSQG